MEPFYAGLAPETAMEMAELSRRLFHLREERKQWLASIGHEDDDQALLDAIGAGRVAEHPGYEIWLASQLSLQQQQVLRERLDWRCRHPAGPGEAWDSAHPLDAIALTLRLPEAFHPDFVFADDGLALRGLAGEEVMIRWLSGTRWSVEWRIGDDLWRLDNAPVAHAGVDTPAHLHCPDGSVTDDPFATHDAALDDAARLQRIIDGIAQSFVA